jgi:hypothetical protein
MEMTPEIWLAIMGLVFSTLLGGNIFFVKRLVDKIDETVTGHVANSFRLTELSQTVSGMGVEVGEIKTDLKELRKIELDVAVLRAQLSPLSSN